MLYYKYKDNSGYIACEEEPADTSLLITIPQEEYDEYIKSLEPTEEEILAEKKALMLQLMKELYGEE